MLKCLGKKPAGAACRVKNRLAQSGIGNCDHEANNGARRVELATFFARRIGEFANQVFVSGTQQVRELEVFVAQAKHTKVRDELAQLDVGDLALTDLACEIDMFEYVIQAGIGCLDTGQRLIQKVADVLMCVVEQEFVA